MKRSCNGCICKLLKGNKPPFEPYCDLGFKIKLETVKERIPTPGGKKKSITITTHTLRPKEECSKPRTYGQWADAELMVKKAKREAAKEAKAKALRRKRKPYCTICKSEYCDHHSHVKRAKS